MAAGVKTKYYQFIFFNLEPVVNIIAEPVSAWSEG
jgi:hypothetical protein